jgi:hypothetical protein
VYFPHRTFVSDVSEIPISFPFPELPFSILFPIKNMKTVMVLVFTDRFRPFSSLVTGYDPLNPGLVWFLAWLQSWRAKQGEFSRVWIFQLI